MALLRALLGFALELLNGPVHGFDCLVLFDDLQSGGLISLLPGLAANIVDRRIDALLDRELEFALLFLQRTLPSEHLSLSLLGFRQFDVVGCKGGAQLLGFLRLRLQFGPGGFARLLGFRGCYLTSLGLEPCVDLVFKLLFGCGELFLLFAQGFHLFGNLGVLAGQLLLKPLAVFLDERRCKRFRQSNFMVAIRAVEGGRVNGHGCFEIH